MEKMAKLIWFWLLLDSTIRKSNSKAGANLAYVARIVVMLIIEVLVVVEVKFVLLLLLIGKVLVLVKVKLVLLLLLFLHLLLLNSTYTFW